MDLISKLVRRTTQRRRRQDVLERAYRVLREDFVEDLRGYAEKMSQGTVMRSFNVEGIARLNRKAQLFMGEPGFNRLWTAFVAHYEHEAAVAYFDLDRELAPDLAIQVARNLNHCFEARQAIVAALVECLSGTPGAGERLDARLAALTARSERLGMADLFPNGRDPSPLPEAS